MAALDEQIATGGIKKKPMATSLKHQESEAQKLYQSLFKKESQATALRGSAFSRQTEGLGSDSMVDTKTLKASLGQAK